MRQELPSGVIDEGHIIPDINSSLSIAFDPVLRAPFISAMETGTGISSCFKRLANLLRDQLRKSLSVDEVDFCLPL